MTAPLAARLSRLRSRRAGLVVGAAGAGLTLLTMSLAWAAASGGSSTADARVLTGREAVPAAFALSLAALAGVGVLLLVGRTGRRVVGSLLVLLGCGTVVSAAGAALDLHSRAVAALSSTAVAGVNQGAPLVDTSPWWAWVAALGGVLVVLAGALSLLGGPGWPEPARRYGSAGPGRPSDPWRALDQGVDPTLDD